MQTASTLEMLRKEIAKLREAQGATIGLVPTMGALHDGHLTLVRRAREHCDHVVASIFVNPTQFGPNEDLDAYPRQLERDAEMLEREGCALLWAPTVDVMYPDGFVTNISVSKVSEGFCGADRPGHFDGVATVVSKLFNQAQPDMAFFGEKDFQQLAVIRSMARDLDLTFPYAHQIVGIPTVREPDGLAMSSRNRYLSDEERQAAATLPSTLKASVGAVEGGQPISEVLNIARDTLSEAGFEVDYVAIVDASSLEPIDTLTAKPARILAAAKLGKTRLIDNMAIQRA